MKTFDDYRSELECALHAAKIDGVEIHPFDIDAENMDDYRRRYHAQGIGLHHGGYGEPFLSIYPFNARVMRNIIGGLSWVTETCYELETVRTVHNYPHEPDDVEPVTMGTYDSWGDALAEAVLMQHRSAICAALENLGIDRMLAEEESLGIR